MIAQTDQPNETVHAVAVQRAIIDCLRVRTRRQGRRNVEPIRGDGRRVSYPDDSFDAAYLVLVLGEMPAQERALAELARVLKSGSQLVAGESLLDQHFVTLVTLRRRAERRGFRFEDRVGTRVGYFARFDEPLSVESRRATGGAAIYISHTSSQSNAYRLHR